MCVLGRAATGCNATFHLSSFSAFCPGDLESPSFLLTFRLWRSHACLCKRERACVVAGCMSGLGAGTTDCDVSLVVIMSKQPT